MDKIKRCILIQVPTSICNLRCRYCYIGQRDEGFQGEQAAFQYSPERVAAALSIERMGGPCYINLCGDGETLLTKNIEKYIFELAKAGHYVEIVTNLTVTKVIDEILSFEQCILDHITFKCSFHYLQLKERNMLDVFTSNVKKIWDCCSANIEITPDDELIPYIDEVKEYSLSNYGALPHLSIARDDREGHGYLTKLNLDEYDKLWGSFESDFWKFKKTIFNKKRKEYCYAGAWSLYINLATGHTTQCYCSKYFQNIFEDINKQINFVAIGQCEETHCYNGHALLTLGCIPYFTDVRYGNIRDRVREDGSHWIRPQMLDFLNTKLEYSNACYNDFQRARDKRLNYFMLIKSTVRKAKVKLAKGLNKG